MSTDPFQYVLKPVAGEYQEISQTTFVELVSAKRNTVRPAFKTSKPSVKDSLNRVAFGRTCYGTTHDPSPGHFVAAPPRIPLSQYTIRNQSTIDVAKEIEIARRNTELRSLIANVNPRAIEESNISLQASPGNIAGYVWHDIDGNGVWDDGEPALGGWYVYIDRDNSCTIALGEPAAVTSEGTSWPSSGQLGYYRVEDVESEPVIVNGVQYSPPWKLRLILPPAPNGQTWRVSYPPEGYHLINVVPGGTLNNINFGVTLTDPIFPDCPGVCPVDLAIVLDDTISMGPVISNIKNGIRDVLETLQTAVGLNFRLSLTTFKDSINSRYTFVDKCGDMACGIEAIDNLITALNTVTPSGGGDVAEWSAAALKYVVEGNSGGWRNNATRVALLITDAANNASSGVTAQDAANAALAAGVQVMYAATPAKNPDMVNEGRIYENITNGVFVETDLSGSGLPELLTSFIYGLCVGSVPQRICEGGTDEILNGSFNTGIEGWIEHTTPVSWNESKKAMLIGAGGEARQTITDLNPGDRLVLSANVETDTPGSISYGSTFDSTSTEIAAGETIRVSHAFDIPESGEVTVRFRSNFVASPPQSTPDCPPPTDPPVGVGSVSGTVWNDLNGNGVRDPGDPGYAGIWVYADLNDDCLIGLLENAAVTDANGNYTIYNIPSGQMKIRVTLPLGLSVTAPTTLDHCDQGSHFICINPGENTPNIDFGVTGVPPTSGASFYVDDVVACVYRVDDCGPGTSNTVQNANFRNNVRHWTDASGTALPETDPAVWDPIIQAIIVNIAEYEEVRTDINLIPGESYLLTFDVVSSQPDTIQEVSIEYGILNGSGVIIAEDNKSNSDMGTLPYTATLSFTAPNDGVASIFIKGGEIGGVTKIKNVLVCDPTGICPPGSTRLAYDDFSVGRDGWGGIWEDEAIKLTSGPGGGTISTGKQFTGLEPGSTVEVSLNLKSESYANFDLVSGSVINQTMIGPTRGRYSNSIVVQSTGTVNVFVKISSANFPISSYTEVIFDDVLTCMTAPVPCIDNVNNCRAFIKWNGVPRRPFNVFNSVIRYTIRNQTTFDTTDYTYAAINEQHSSASTCDFWRQCGDDGVVEDEILRSGLNPNTIGSISNGDLADVSGKTNWLWSVPLNVSPTSDELVVYYPPPPVGQLVEKVSIFFLDQYCQPSGSLTPPVLPPPVLCGPDPAEEVEFGIRYVNHADENREFSTTKTINQLWWQEIDFGQFALPWDTISAVGDGYKGPIARWSAVEFILDSVAGTGLDQCTLPVDQAQSASSARMSFSKFGLEGKAFFLDEYVLPVVDPGPYEYPLPVGEASVICQSNPPLTRPGPDDGAPISDDPCCSPETVSEGANFADHWCLERDLFDPYQNGCCGALTVRDLAVKKNLNPDLYNPYVVDWQRGMLVGTIYTQIIKGRETFVLVEKEVDTDDGRSYIMSRLQRHGLQIDVLTNLT